MITFSITFQRMQKNLKYRVIILKKLSITMKYIASAKYKKCEK